MISESSDELCGLCGHNSHQEDGCDLVALKATMLVRDRVIPAKARLSLPSCLVFAGASRGGDNAADADDLGLYRGEWVQTKENLARGTWFGPLDTPRTRRLRGLPRIKLASIQNRGGLPLWYDTSDPAVCNWMMLVPICKKSQILRPETESLAGEANLLVIEHDGKIYYVAPREIRQGERLKAAYSPAYRKAIDKLLTAEKKRGRMKTSGPAPTKRKGNIQTSTENESGDVIRYICASCSVCFESELEFQKHIQDAHRNTDNGELGTALDEPLDTRDGRVSRLPALEGPTTQHIDDHTGVQQTEPASLPERSTAEIVNFQPRGVPASGGHEMTLSAGHLLEGGDTPQEHDELEGSTKVIHDLVSGERHQTLEGVLQDEQDAVDTLAAMGSTALIARSEQEIGERPMGHPLAGSIMSTNSAMRTGAACHICLKWLSSAATVRSHIRSCQLPAEGDLPDSGACRYCGLVLTSLPEYRRHVLSHLLEHECPLCRARFRLESLVISHACPCLRASRELTIEHRCDVCEVDVGNLISTEVHLRLGCQGRRRPHKCNRCEQTFYLQSSLERHLCLLNGEEGLKEIDSEITGPVFVCETCGALLSSMSSLNKHRATHASPAFSCAECGKSFHRRDGLEGHMATHIRHRERQQQQQQPSQIRHNQQRTDVDALSVKTSEAVDTSGVTVSPDAAPSNATIGNHSCHICGKRLSSRSSLRVHLRGHGSKYRFSCPHCERAYNQKINLEKHLISSHQSVKFWCGECERSFTSKESLDLHSLDHQGAVRKHRCLLCSAAFHRAYQLRKHQRHLHNGRIFSCPLCAASMKLASSLLRHLRTIHSDRPDVAAKQAEAIANLDRYPPPAEPPAGYDHAVDEADPADVDQRDLETPAVSVDEYGLETRAAVQDIASEPSLVEDSDSLQLSSVTY